MGAIHTNNYSSTLNGAILAADTTIIVNSDVGLPNPTGGDYFTLTLDDQAGTVEIVHCTARTGTSLTVIRGQGGTSPLNWPTLSLIENRLTANTIDSKITALEDDLSPTAVADIDLNGNEILNGLRIRTDIVSKASDTTNNIEFTTSRQTFKPFNSDVMNITSAGLQLGAANSRVNTIRDEDDMVSDSNTSLATQQSIKAYVDSFSQQRAKAWGTYDQSSGITVLDSYNVASISNDGTGLATVTLSTPMSNSNYVVVAMHESLAIDKVGSSAYAFGSSVTASSFQLSTNKDNGDVINSSRVSFVVFGDQ